jgi:hypothetical protein
MGRLNRTLLLLGLAVLILLPIWALEGRLGESSLAEPLAVQFSHPTGYYENGIRLELDVPAPGARVRFTTDGSQPTTSNGTDYHKPLYLTDEPESVVVVRAQAIAEDGTLGPEANATYFLGLDVTLPVLSLMVEPDDLWGEERGIFFRPGDKGQEWERFSELVYLDESKQVGFIAPAGIRVHGHQSRWSAKKSLRLYFRPEYGLAELNYPLFPDSQITAFKRLVLDSGAQDQPAETGNGTLLRKPLVNSMAEITDVIVSEDRPVILYINGKLWGIYFLRERMDSIFFADHFGVGDLDILGYYPFDPEPFEGGWTHWEELMAYVGSHDLNDPDNYETIQSQIDLDNFLTYHAFQILIGNIDWPQISEDRFHPHVQGGKWHWFLWDSDWAFGLARGSGVFPDPVTWLLTDEEAKTGREQNRRDVSTLFLKLMDNPDFELAFIRRLEALLNTAFLPEIVTAELDSLAEQVGPDIDLELLRWPSSGDWAESVEQMRNYARRRPGFVRENVIKELGLAGTVDLAFDPARGRGRVMVNGMPVPGLPWSGVFFTGVPIEVTALPDDGYRFAGWESADLPQTKTLILTDDFPERIRPLFEEDTESGVSSEDVAVHGDGLIPHDP